MIGRDWSGGQVPDRGVYTFGRAIQICTAMRPEEFRRIGLAPQDRMKDEVIDPIARIAVRFLG